jgi:hypothetical protein
MIIEFRTPPAFPPRTIQQRTPGLHRYESFDTEPEVKIGCFRGVLWALILEAIVLGGTAFCRMVTHHTFHA